MKSIIIEAFVFFATVSAKRLHDAAGKPKFQKKSI
jgi:hypothetical protein